MTEEQLHRACVEWAGYKGNSEIPELRLLFHPGNGGKRPYGEAGRFKALGVKPGVPDLCLPVRRGLYASAWFELKSEKGTLTKEQRWWLAELDAQGHFVCVIRTPLEFEQKVTWYLGMEAYGNRD